MAKAALPTTVTTPRFRNSFPAIFAPKLNKLSNSMEYSLQALFEKDADLGPLKQAAKNACINKWGPDPKKWPAKLKDPFKSQKDLIESAKQKEQKADHLDEKAVYMTYKMFAKDKKGKDLEGPTVFGKNPKEVITEESRFYAGCWAKANVNAWAYDKGGNCGVTFYLNACQFVGDAERFSGRPTVESAFEAIPEELTGGNSVEDGQVDATSMFS